MYRCFNGSKAGERRRYLWHLSLELRIAISTDTTLQAFVALLSS